MLYYMPQKLFLTNFRFRIYKNIMDSVKKRGPAFKKVFDYCYEYKKYWMKRGRGKSLNFPRKYSNSNPILF